MTNQIITDTQVMPQRMGASLAITELRRCAESPSYFINKYVTVRSPIDGEIPLNLYPVQEHLLHQYIDNRFNIVCDSRQTGTTVVTAAFILHKLLFGENQHIGYLSNKLMSAKELISIVQYMYEGLPDWLQISSAHRLNRDRVELSNGNKVMAYSTSAGSLRGTQFSLIVCDNFAMNSPKNQEMLMSDLQILGSTGTHLTIISIPGNTPKDPFSYMWWSAHSPDDRLEFVPTTIPWYSITGRDREFRENNITLLGEERWHVEYECRFVK